MATTLAYRAVLTAGTGRAVSDRSEMPQHAAQGSMPTLGHELLRVYRLVVEIRFGRQSLLRAFASFSNLRNDLVEQVRGASGWSYHPNHSPSRDRKQP